MRRKWFPFFLVILLVTSPFASVSEVYAMSHSSKEDEQNNDSEDRDKELDVDEQDSSTDEAVSEEIKLKLGDDDEQILDLKEDLTELGFAALEKPTTYYGLHTEEAVKAFQEFYDIEDTGVADEDTLLQIEYILSDDSFDREEHLEFSKPEEFVTEEEEVEELPAAEAEEDAEAEAEESSEEAAEEETEADTEENAEEATEEESEADTEDSSEEATEEESEADTEDSSEEATEEESEADTEDSSEEATEEESEADTEENAEEATEEESEADTEDSSEEATEEETEADTEKNAEEATEEESGTDTEENAELEKEQEISIQSFARATVFSANGTFKQGDRHQEIVKLKKQLNGIGFGYITETNLFGSFMETQVKRFQTYYGLTANGQMNQATKNKLNSVYNSPLQRGKRHNDIPEIKRQLNSLGYGHISVTTLFGSFMEQKIKQFQRDYGLRVNGIADEVTVDKLKELAPKDTYQRGDRHAEVVQFKKQLNAIGFGYITETNLYGSFMETQVKRFQSYYGLSATGKMNKATKDKLNSIYNHPLQRGKRHNDIPEIKRQLNSLGYGHISVTTLFGSFMEQKIKQFQRDNNLRVNGIADERTLEALDEAISNRWVINHETYDVTFNQALNTQMNQLQQTDMYRNEPAYVHKNYVNGSNRTTANVNVRSSASSSSHIYGQISSGTQVTILGSTGNWYRISYNAWRNPTRSDVSSYLNPDNNDIFQHLDLTSSVGVTASSLNNDILKGKGILAGRGQAFITAGKQHSVNEIYLISHALLETGNGSSALATGIEVGINSSGNPVVVTSSNRNSLRNIRTTYNMYGIGAVDGNAHNGGAVRAYNEGWFSPEQAIIGGARFIGNSYIHNQYNQNTLYKMRWNPANPGYPQYATDIGWAVKQVPSIKRLYDMLNNPVFKFNITQYR